MDWIQPDEPVDEPSLVEALEIIIGTAHQNGVSIERDWPCRSEDDPDWDVDIVRLASGDDNDE